MILDLVSRIITKFLERPSALYQPVNVTPWPLLKAALKPGDVLLVEGNQKISMAIKYLTQSTWSHAAVYVGETLPEAGYDAHEGIIIEADVRRGVIATPLAKYAHYHTRICRAESLTEDERRAVVHYLVESLGRQYDLRNVFDLVRYLLPTPPVPIAWRRRMLALGSGDPTRAICSTLIAEAFQSVNYPILPAEEDCPEDYVAREIRHIRHYSLYTPRDFDLSPFFRIVKPTLEAGFDHHKLVIEVKPELPIRE